ncbi:MAG: hypothetical protein Q8K91_15130 [Hylemonella sp.]|nr:hypothetical protein [Hylemonella sp.]
MKRFILASLLVMAGSAWTQDHGFIQLDTGNEWQSFVGTGENAHRIGGGVLTHVHSYLPRTSAAVSQKVLLDCKGRWIARITAMTRLVTQEQFSAPTQEAYARANEQSTSELPDPVALIPFNQMAAVFYAASLRAKVSNLCASAMPEPRDIFIPMPSDPLDAHGVGRAYAMTGLASIHGNEVTYWNRGTDFTLEKKLRSDGSPLLNKDGAPEHYKKALAKGHALFKTKVDCKERKSALLQITQYDENGQAVSTSEGPFLPMREVRPGSSAEQALDIVCALYFDAPRL